MIHHARKGAINCAPTFLILILCSSVYAFDLEGNVKLAPPHPTPALLQIDEKHQAECGKGKVSAKLKISPEGGVANAVVKIEIASGASRPRNDVIARRPKAGAAILDQVNCEFSPHVLLVPQGAQVEILNSEAMLHNVRAFDETTEMLFNVAMPKKGQVLKKKFDRPGRIIVRCGVHPWMHAMLIVQEHPFYTLTDESGHFKMEGIPDGNYTVSVWHESLGELKKEIAPTSGQLEFVYPAVTQSTR